MLCLEKRDGVDRWTNILQTLSSLGLLCVVWFTFLLSRWYFTLLMWHGAAVPVSAVHVFIRSHLNTFLFFFLTAELKAVSQLFALPCFGASAEHILWHLIACYLNFKKHGAELCLRRCIKSRESKEAQWSNSSSRWSEIKTYQTHFIKIIHIDVQCLHISWAF